VGLKLTVFEASNIRVNSLIAGAKIYMMIRGPEDSRLIISTLKYFIHEETTVLFGVLAAEALDVSIATVLSRLHNSLGMKTFHLRWVTYQLTDDLRQARVAKCDMFLRALEAIQRTHFRHIITGDESWFYLEYQHASQ
jgi:hypothetical protein